ncbi:zf-HC2 domain-containing protein [Brevibacillus daliensis]|uniref:zf-HC2 domain-containing protein n=1 Tax=Brevibacillus daliensis TaxID=2892995 RepID=UPI001E5FCEA6|nr:zf-HC2 domain-containing protein [Brevibacillus daliensis]
MRCEEIQDLLQEYVKGSLSELSERRVQNHIGQCEHCNSQYTVVRDSSYYLQLNKEKYNEDTQPSKSIVDAVMTRILSEEKWAIPIGKKIFTVTVRMRRMGLAAAMFLLMIFSFTLYNQTGNNMDVFLSYTAKAEALSSDSIGPKADVSTASESDKAVQIVDSLSSDQAVQKKVLPAEKHVKEIASDAMDYQTGTEPNFGVILSLLGIFITVITMSWFTRA